MFKLNSTYYYSLVDLSQSELLLFGLKLLIEKQNDDNSKLQNKLGINPVKNNGMLLCFLNLSSNYRHKNTLIRF